MFHICKVIEDIEVLDIDSVLVVASGSDRAGVDRSASSVVLRAPCSVLVEESQGSRVAVAEGSTPSPVGDRHLNVPLRPDNSPRRTEP
jgi:hypothetical protein